MYIKNLQLINFRSYEKIDLNLKPGVNIFIGKNGEGKTNIVESVIFQTFLNSHRVSTVQPLIKLNQETAYIRSKIAHPNRDIDLVLELNSNKPNKAQINRTFDELEVTAMGDSGHKFVKGLEASSVTIDFLNDTASANVLQTLQAAWGTNVTVVFLQDKSTAVSATNPLYTMTCPLS